MVHRNLVEMTKPIRLHLVVAERKSFWRQPEQALERMATKRIIKSRLSEASCKLDTSGRCVSTGGHGQWTENGFPLDPASLACNSSVFVFSSKKL